MMRRLVEIAIIEAFEHRNIANKIKDRNDNYLQLTELIDKALAEPALHLTRNSKKELPKLRNIGHRTAHGRHFTAQRTDIEKVEDGVRVVVQEFLTHAGLI
jgi:acetate kinase